MPDDQVDLDNERRRIDSLWRNLDQTHVALPIAAALTFHQVVHSNGPTFVNRQDYEDALNLAAAALSRLVTIYAGADAPAPGVPLAVDLRHHHFAGGATELRGKDGSARRDLSLPRDELISAIPLIKRAGLPFAFSSKP